MQGSLDRPPIVVRASRRRAIWLVMGSATFVAVGVLVWDPNQSAVMRLLCIGFFGFCGLIGLGMLIAPSRLEIGPSGLAQTVLWRTRRFAWTEVYDFRPALIGLTNKTVGFDYLTERPRQAALRALNTSLAGVQGALQPGWEIAPQALADLLNNARERWLAIDGSAPQADAETGHRPSSFAGVAGARMNRKVYWLSTGFVLAAAIALSFVPGVQRVIGYVTTLMFIRIFASRLHDVGRSGWWQLTLYGAQLAAAIFVGTVGGQPLAVVIAVGLAIQLVFTVALGAIPGDRDANRFGPPPDRPSPIASSEVFR